MRTVGLTVARLLVLGVIVASGVAGWMFAMPGQSYRGSLPDLTDAQRQLSERLRRHVEQLAGVHGRRGDEHPSTYRAARRYIADQLRSMDYQVELEAVETRDTTYHNIVAERRGTRHADDIVLVGAHYDSVAKSPGADDNASGVAGALELARAWSTHAPPDRTLRFVFFANEEQPFFGTDAMGSRVHARRIRRGDESIVVMMSLEMIGYYRDSARTQSYPAGLSWIYPDRGRFIAFVGDLGSRRAVRRSIATFRRHVRHPSEGIAAPSWVPGIGHSDHWAFWQEGYDALMVTDTAFYRNPHYHRPSDRPETLDYRRMARVVSGVREVLKMWTDAT